MSDTGKPDTQPNPDSGPVKCETPNDCPDPMEQVCDPKTRTCVADQCGPQSKTTCAMDQVCVVQLSGATVAACYQKCAPFTMNACPANQECVLGRADGTVAYCKGNGGLATGATCLPSSVETGCVPGDVCVVDPQQRYCREQCDFWTGLHDCSSLACTPTGYCTPTMPDPAAIGAACSSPSGTLCGGTPSKITGVCVGQMPVKCAQWCRTKFNDCPMNQACTPLAIAGLGYCQ